MDRIRGSSVNEDQKKLLIEYVKKHPDLLKGTFSPNFTLLMAKKMWEEISSMLNSVSGGTRKDWRQWRKTWQDLRRNAKAKAGAQKKYSTGTGGGPQKTENFDDTEKAILETIPTISCEGLPINESTIVFDFEGTEKNVSSSNICTDMVIEEIMSVDSPIQDAARSSIIVNDFPIPSTSSLTKTVKRTLEETPNKDQNTVTAGNDHCYSSKTLFSGPIRKRLNKTRRHENSQKLSVDMLKTMEERTSIVDNYYKKKTAFLEHIEEYHNKKLQLLQQQNDIQTNILKDLKNLLQQQI